MKCLGCLVLVCLAGTANAAKHARFEPTDLELDEPGTVNLDLQFGPARSDADGWRVLTPDFALDVGLFDNVELDIDGAYAIQGDAQIVDNLWPSLKIGVADWHDAARTHAWALGVQAGPKVPVGSGDHGIGVEAIALLAHTAGRAHVALAIGGLVDPHATDTARPTGAEAGLDLEFELVPDTWSLLGELGGVLYFSDDADQLAATFGAQYSPNHRIDLSLAALAGLASGSDRFALLLGLSIKLID